MATHTVAKSNLRARRTTRPHSKTVRTAADRELRHVDDRETCETLPIVQRTKRPLLNGTEHPRGKCAGDPVPFLYSPTSQWTIDDVQMFADFFEKFYPPDLLVWRHITYLRSLMDFTPQTPVLQRARRTIGLTHLAAISHDARLVRESRISYGRLLGMLQFLLIFPTQIQTANETRELAASIALLTHISDLPGLSTASDDSWTAHMWAAQQLLTTYAPACLPGGQKLDDGIMRHTVMNGFLLAVAKRKAWNVDTAWFHDKKSKGWTTLIPAYSQLPALLEETDRMLSQRTGDTSALLTLVGRLIELRRRTDRVFKDLRDPVSISCASMDSLDAMAEEHMVMADSSTFPELFAPITQDGGANASKIVMTAFLSLILDCTILRIWHFQPQTLSLVPESLQQEVEQNAYALACKLCKVSLSFTHAEKVVHVSVLRMCLSLARNVFEQQDRSAEMGWCDACLIANQLRMQRIKQTAAPTLCKVEDLTPGIAEAGRYKVKFDPRAFVIRSVQPSSMRLLQ